MNNKSIVILEGARTPWAEYVGTPGYGLFKDISAVQLCAIAAKKAIEKSNITQVMIDNVVIGNAFQTNYDLIYGARHVSLIAGVRKEVPALTVNRLCGSGIESIAVAARFLKLGEANFVLAGGMENMSQAPYVLRNMRGNPKMRFGVDLKLEDTLFWALKDGYCGLFMAQTANNCAKKYGITRQQQDEYALRSHKEGVRAVKEGLFKQEIVPVDIGKGKFIDADDHIKPETTLEKLAELQSAFGQDSTVTAGNASGIVDGAASVVVTTEEKAREHKIRPIGKILGFVACGVDPEYMGLGPIPAIRLLLEKEGLKIQDIDLFEINEAFSGQYLAVEKELELDRSKANVNGGSIALGHPLGATGTRLVLTLLYELKRRKKKLGIASACIGGGQGVAMLLSAENL
ncbi:MAG: thiolase family protein [Planctomycetes bacterium]|nr:thiolase family protein [Planctomycetota bacterium]